LRVTHVVIAWSNPRSLLGRKSYEVWGKTSLEVTVVVLKVKICQLEESEDFAWDNEALLLDESIEWSSSLIKSLLKKSCQQGHVDSSDSGWNNLDIVHASRLNVRLNSHTINDSGEIKEKVLNSDINSNFFSSISFLNVELNSNISIERHSLWVLFSSEVLKRSNLKWDINVLVLSILGNHSWEEQVKNSGVQLNWGGNWNLVVGSPELEGVGLEERVSKGVKHVIRNVSLEFGAVGWVLVWHNWGGNWWCDFALAFWEEETFDSEFKVLSIDLWGGGDRPVEVHLVVDFRVSFLRSNEFVNSWWDGVS